MEEVKKTKRETAKHVIEEVAKQVATLTRMVEKLADAQDSFNERWSGIEEEIRADLKRVADKVDAYAAAAETLSFGMCGSPEKKPKRMPDIFLE